ncbi:MAG TPA: TIGR00269 family protein [Candidatus Bathyarchaeia archaeon]|nr:TIGR00269 family protein [Candidatus Bathyarchaeia archaeon]
MKCDKCSAPAVLFQRYSGLHLCKAHFFADVEKKIKKEVRKEQIEGTLAVAFSGGKDSAVVLTVLHSLFAHRGAEIIAITVDEGIAGYREKTLESAATLVAKLGVRWRVASFEEHFDVTIDRLGQRQCTICGILRRSLLNRLAKMVGASTLATGHNLDDEAQTVLMNYLRGDIDRLLRLHHPVKEGLVRRVKPLKYVPEKEVALYAILKGIPMSLDECRFATGVFRAEVRGLVNEIESNHPGTKYALVKGLDRILGLMQPEPFQLGRCTQCGEPTVTTLCQSCKILKSLRPKGPETD